MSSIRELYWVTDGIFLKYCKKSFEAVSQHPEDKAKLTDCISGAITELTAILSKISEM